MRKAKEKYLDLHTVPGLAAILRGLSNTCKTTPCNLLSSCLSMPGFQYTRRAFYNKTSMPRIFLIGKDWSSRALLRAQLLEEGIGVEAHETSRDALNTVTALTDLPKLIVADLQGSSNPECEIDLLSKWRPLIPIWLITSRAIRVDRNLDAAGLERVIPRPVDIKQFVEEIRQRVG
jgi:CheY-like chemotaxis protein